MLSEKLEAFGRPPEIGPRAEVVPWPSENNCSIPAVPPLAAAEN
jgi:hypothetical protein